MEITDVTDGPEKKAPISDEERLALAAKLDDDLDEFINSLEKKKYTEGWNEETWKEDMDRHPFFMKKAPEPGEELHPMLEGLQQLKFDPAENTNEELAEKYKEDGNYYMKMKKYRIAIMNYTEGINFKHENAELSAALLNNRSAAHFFLQNYRSAMMDAKKSLKHKPVYPKVMIRVVKCLLALKKYEDACTHIDEYLIQDPTNKELIEFQKEAATKKTAKQRDERKLQMAEKKKRQEFQTVVQALINRKAKFEEVKGGDLSSKLTPDIIKPIVEPLENHPVSLDKHGILYWPVIFCYPEYQLSDLQQQLSEEITLYDCLVDMFKTSFEEDQQQKYPNVDMLNFYYENRLTAKVHKANPKKMLKEIIAEPSFLIHSGYLTLYVIPKNTKTESEFVNQKRIPLER